MKQNPIFQLSLVEQSALRYLIWKKNKNHYSKCPTSITRSLCNCYTPTPHASLTSLFLFHPQPSSISPKAPLAHVHQDLPLALHTSGVPFLETANLMKLPLLLVPWCHFFICSWHYLHACCKADVKIVLLCQSVVCYKVPDKASGLTQSWRDKSFIAGVHTASVRQVMQAWHY